MQLSQKISVSLDRGLLSFIDRDALNNWKIKKLIKTGFFMVSRYVSGLQTM